jgi:hypothetical protein
LKNPVNRDPPSRQAWGDPGKHICGEIDLRKARHTGGFVCFPFQQSNDRLSIAQDVVVPRASLRVLVHVYEEIVEQIPETAPVTPVGELQPLLEPWPPCE